MEGHRFDPRQKGREKFLLQSSLSMLTLFGVRSRPSLSQWHVKDSGHCGKSAGGSLQINTYTLLTQRSRSGLALLSRHGVETYRGHELTRNPSGNARQQSSQLPEPPWTGPGLKSGMGVHEPISALKKRRRRRRRKAQTWNDSSNRPLRLSQNT